MLLRDLILAIDRLMTRVAHWKWEQIIVVLFLYLFLPAAFGFLSELTAQFWLNGHWSWVAFLLGASVPFLPRLWKQLVWWADTPYRKARFVENQLYHEMVRKW